MRPCAARRRRAGGLTHMMMIITIVNIDIDVHITITLYHIILAFLPSSPATDASRSGARRSARWAEHLI